MAKKIEFLLFIFLLVIPISCASIRPISPEVNLMALEVDEITLSHVNMVASLRFYNPNETHLTISGLKYTLFLNDMKVSQGRTARTVEISPDGFGTMPLRISSAYWDILKFLNKTQSKEELHFFLKGTIKVRGVGVGHTFNFDKEGMIPLVHKQ